MISLFRNQKKGVFTMWSEYPFAKRDYTVHSSVERMFVVALLRQTEDVIYSISRLSEYKDRHTLRVIYQSADHTMTKEEIAGIEKVIHTFILA